MNERINQATELLRQAAAILEGLDGGTILPGWEIERCGEREHRIREAAQAVVANDDPDFGTKVPYASLGALAQYLGDIIEE